MTQPANKSDNGASVQPDGSAVPVGTIGEFTNAQGQVCQCVVRGHDTPPWDNLCLLVDYVHPDGHVVKGAMIGADGFRPDVTYQPNDKLSEPPTKTP